VDMFNVSDARVSLYLHIPFCTTCCSYCAFYSEPKTHWNGNLDSYVQRLLQEVILVEQDVPGFDTIFIGGGNPGCLSVEQLTSLLRSAQRKKKSREVTIEMNPESFNESFFPLFAQNLVTRLSIGIQSMQDSVLKQLQRNARRIDNLRAIELAEKARALYGIDISFDLMAALPGQSLEMIYEDIDTLLSLSTVEHLSLYCLSVEEGTELARQVATSQTTVYDDDQQMTILLSVWEKLKREGFCQYEVSNFAKHGSTCLHNERYWQYENYIGLGSSAASLIKTEQTMKHVQQTQALSEFAQSPLFSGYQEEFLDTNEQIEEYLLMALRTTKGISKQYLLERWGIVFDQYFAKKVATLDETWYTDTKQSFSITENGYMVLDEIILRLALAISGPLDRH